MAVDLLPGILASGASIAVEVAWGADINAAYSSWAWTDITTDVRISNGINLKHGRGDEASFSQPASCALVLDNTTGAYSRGGQSPNWPNVRKNTPVRVLIDHDGNAAFTAVFIGYADSWQPVWDQSANVATVHLTASGLLRRLAQHEPPIVSAIRRRLSKETNVAAYWPLEEGKLATQAQSGVIGKPDAVVSGTVDFASDTDSFPASLQLPVMKGGAIWGSVSPYTFTATTGVQFRALVSIPDSGTGMVDDTSVFRLYFDNPTLTMLDVRWSTAGAGGFFLRAYSYVGRVLTNFYTSGTLTGYNGLSRRLYLQMKQVGATVDFLIGMQEPGGNGVQIGGAPTATLGNVTEIQVTPDQTISGLAVGHVVLQNTITSIFDDAKELDAFDGEHASTRFTRLGTESAFETSAFGDGTSASDTSRMGQQPPQAAYQILQDVQNTERGVIFDGLNHGGLTFHTKRALESQAADMTIDVAAGDLAGVLDPTDDDQGLLNKATVKRARGGSATYEDVTGPLGTGTVGTYDSSLTINAAADASLIQFASWLVANGTVEGYRYPKLDIDLAARPDLAAAVLALTPGDRVDLVNIAAVAPQHPAAPVALLVQGWEQTITPQTWRVSMTCTPYGPWGVGRASNSDGTPGTGTTDEQIMRADTAGSQLNAGASAGATSLSVATTAGPIWTTTAGDFPLKIEVGGIVATVTAISGASSPQTFTVTGVTKALASGLAVQVHGPQVLGL